MSLAKLLKLADCDSLPADCRQWLRDGIAGFVDGNGTLDDCLEIRCEESQVFEIRRDRHLRRAAKHIEATSSWQRSVLLAKEVTRFETVFWPKWKLKVEPPSGASQVRKHLFYARREKQLPGSIRHLYRILTE